MIGTLPKTTPASRHSPTHATRRSRCRARTTRRHLRRARDERHERPHDRHEPAEDDRLAAVLLEERVRAIEVLAVHQPAERAVSSVA
jgi:hypothetical protein